ncbi:IS21 family transposase [Nodularia sp. LEGE 06071]|uniref:IS21 family transposase n=1 Tax=Nodularia sp. LEGE 06071 TaxID=2777965 RepID=UPI00188189AB|nr:IS21 family transposase [Nodularia sp. LEGE 06071]MBE9202129.1 IS21 family transposase [Nodularia sp. LEGE 06071]
MSREGFSTSKICRELVLDWRTVRNYLAMSEADFDSFMASQAERSKILHPYEGFVKAKLQLHQDTSAAQLHDWLKEHHQDFPKVSVKTVFNFVAWVRQKYHLPRLSPVRDYEMVEELAYGKQAQVDFGEYNLRTSDGKRVKVFFFTIVLARSRYKYVWFTDQYFTAALAIEAHENAFRYFQGVPSEIVYDQDKVFIVSENSGDIILTSPFKAYIKEKSFTLHFCRKADPESKGKVENLVKYTKQNFLYNRTFYDIETLNMEALAWLGRTANAMVHNGTKKLPCAEWEIEKAFLTPTDHYVIKPSPVHYTVRKDNAISWKGNFYSLPAGTYKGRGSSVAVMVENDHLIVTSHEGMEICRHSVATGKGLKIKNTDHTRDKSTAIQEMMDQCCRLLDDPDAGMQFLHSIKKDKARYIRDQIMIFKDTIEKTGKEIINRALAYCIINQIASATDFKAVAGQYSLDEAQQQPKVIPLNPLSGQVPSKAHIEPATSNIEDYEKLLKPNINHG